MMKLKPEIALAVIEEFNRECTLSSGSGKRLVDELLENPTLQMFGNLMLVGYSPGDQSGEARAAFLMGLTLGWKLGARQAECEALEAGDD